MLSALSLFALLLAAPPGPDAVNAVLGDISAHALRPGQHLTETERITTHLTYVERRLRAAPVRHLTPQQQTRRAAVLDRVRRYRLGGVFPRNTHPLRRPVFIDADDRRCAVAAVAEPELGTAPIEAIAARQPLAYIGEIDDPAVAEWAEDHGLALDELAMIQPSYSPPSRFETRPARDLVRRARARLEADWRLCAGSMWSGNALVDLPAARTGIIFYPLRGWLAGRVVLTPSEPMAEPQPALQAQLFGQFAECVSSTFGTRRFHLTDAVEPGRLYPIDHDFPRGALAPGGRLDRRAAEAVIAMTAMTQGGCVAGGRHGRWRLRVRLDRTGRATRVTATPRARQPGDRAIAQCLEATLTHMLGVFPPGRPMTLTSRVTFGEDPAQVTLRHTDKGFGHTTLDQAQSGLTEDWQACLAERYPIDAGYVEHGWQPTVVFTPDGHRHRGTLRFDRAPGAAHGPPTEALDQLVGCASERFERRRFHLDSGAPGERYPIQWGVRFTSGPVDGQGGLAYEALRLHVGHLARALIGACPTDPPQTMGWWVTVRADVGGRLAGLTVESRDAHHDPAARACIEAALRERIELPPVTRASSARVEARVLPSWLDETLRPYRPPTE